MRKTILALFIVLGLSSCSKQSQEKEKALNLDLVLQELPQDWKLVKMSGMLVNSETTGNEMAWQESYSFSEDQGFIKTRTTNEGETLTAEGTFQIEENPETSEKFIVLTYEEDNSIIGNCSREAVEYLYYDKEDKMLLSNWWACDGPGLFYEKTKTK